ncbi:MAG: outer membrane beta-barrel protein [Bacteroidota bacterium]
MKTSYLALPAILLVSELKAQHDSLEKIPFDRMDMTWQNGSDRRESPVLQGKYVSGIVMLDVNYTYSFHNPVDHTVIGSTALARNNEIQVSSANLGGEFSYRNARARIVTQFGTRSTLIPRNDYSVYKGQYELSNMYRYLSEAYGGYHFKKWYGINVDAGMFMSYIGLNSYYQVENWEYQASFTSDNTPWFFNGLRIQIYPSKQLKIEPWIVNGWQSYGRFNSMPGLGGNITWCPKESIKLLTNNYYGKDAAGIPNRRRFHSDNSFLLRYLNKAQNKRISRMAFSFTADIGFEKGGGVNGFRDDDSLQGPAQYFASLMFYHRTWFKQNTFAWTIGGGWMKNPGRYLVLLPSGDASTLPNPYNPIQTQGTHPFTANPGDSFEGWDCSTNLDWMPNQSITFPLEYVHREASVPYFAGKGGVTSPGGYTTTPLPANWKPDLVKHEDRVVLVMLFRL